MSAHPKNARAAAAATAFRARLREAVERSGMSHRAISAAAGVAHAQVSQLLRRDNGQTYGPGTFTVEAIAKAIGVAPAWLAFGDDVKPTQPSEAPAPPRQPNTVAEWLVLIERLRTEAQLAQLSLDDHINAFGEFLKAGGR